MIIRAKLPHAERPNCGFLNLNTIEIMPMQATTFIQCITGASKDACRFVINKPHDLVVMLAIVALIKYACISPMRNMHPIVGQIERIAYLITIMLNVQVLRYCLLKNTAERKMSRFDKSFWRYFGFNWLLALFCLFILGAAFGGSYLCVRLFSRLPIELTYAASALQAFVALSVCVYLVVRLCLLPTNMAIGGEANWRMAWADTKGSFWKIWWTWVTIALPFATFTGLTTFLLSHLASHLNAAWFAMVISTSQAIFIIAGGILGGTINAWIYRRFASEKFKYLITLN